MLLRSILSEQLDFSGFTMNKTLNSEIWNDMKLHKDIRTTLLKIAKDYIDSLDITVKLKDITFTGSLANFNWSKHSDVDLHIIIDLGQIEHKTKIKDLLDIKTDSWNAKHNITIKGYDVELYLQLHDQEHHSTGVYSVLHNKWVTKPKFREVSINKKQITRKYNKIVDTFNDIQADYKKHKDYLDIVDRLEALRDKIKKMRTAGLETKGEFSTENIVFKLIRRNDIMGKLKDLLTKAYDKSVSINEVYVPSLNEYDI